MVKIVMAGPPPAQRLAQFQQAYPSVQFVSASKRDEAIKLVEDCDAFFGGITDDEFKAAGKLRWVQSPSAGVEWMWKIPTIADSSVVVTNARGAHAATIAEHTFALLLALTRQVKMHYDYQAKKEWVRGELSRHLVGIKGLTMGIIGFGNIGRNIGRRAAAFEMEVLAVDAHPGAPGDGVAEVWPLERLNDMCGRADVLVISAPITPQTRGMVGREQIGAMKRGSYLVAVSRGGIVDEPALIDALSSGQLAGAGLDVQATEPMESSDPLWSAPNILLTPHDSGASTLTTDLMWSIFFENVGHFVKGEPLTNTVDKKLGY
jgi:phosphoglycerate dehydrogenase-like enzyme